MDNISTWFLEMLWVYNKLIKMKLAPKICSKSLLLSLSWWSTFTTNACCTLRNWKTEVSIFPTHLSLSHICAFVKAVCFTWLPFLLLLLQLFLFFLNLCMSNSCSSIKAKLKSNVIIIKELLTLLNRYVFVHLCCCNKIPQTG